ncbi:MAG: hypothetical protein IPN29_15250 [Saprospiraceae bacterium]|nr:hypothetical protein [Saprospiraceae bacterium]
MDKHEESVMKDFKFFSKKIQKNERQMVGDMAGLCFMFVVRKKYSGPVTTF